MTNIIAGMVSLLEGTTGDSVNAITSGTLKHVAQPVEELRVRPAQSPRPFNLRAPRLTAGAVETGDYPSADQMRGTHDLDIVIAYGTQPHDPLGLLGAILDDETRIRAALEWESNVALTDGWTGAEVISASIVDVEGEGEDAPPRLVTLVLTVRVSHRDQRTT